MGIAVAGFIGIAAPVFIYAVRLAYEDYYRAFGVTFDEIGLGHGRMFGLASLSIIVLAMLIATIVGLPVGGAFVARRRLDLSGPLTALLAFFFYFLWIVPLLVFHELGWPDWSLLLLFLLLGAIPLAIPFLSEGLRVRALRSLRIPKHWNVVAMARTISGWVWFVMMAVLAGIWVVVWLNAFETARSLNPDGTTSPDGRVEKGMADLVLGVLDSRPEPVCILRLSGDQIAGTNNSEIGLGDPKLLLGAANGATVLYELSDVNDEDGYALRVPTSQVVLGPTWNSLEGLTCVPPSTHKGLSSRRGNDSDP
jgi:hypothetical protein